MKCRKNHISPLHFSFSISSLKRNITCYGFLLNELKMKEHTVISHMLYATLQLLQIQLYESEDWKSLEVSQCYKQISKPPYLSLFCPCSRVCLIPFTVCSLLLTSGSVLGISWHSFSLSLVRSTQSWHSWYRVLCCWCSWKHISMKHVKFTYNFY